MQAEYTRATGDDKPISLHSLSLFRASARKYLFRDDNQFDCRVNIRVQMQVDVKFTQRP